MAGRLPGPEARWAFSTLGCSGASWDELAALAGRHGFEGLELRVADDEPLRIGLPAHEAKVAARRLAGAGLSVVALNTYVRLCAPFEPDERRDHQSRHLSALVTLAQGAGASGIRVFMRDDDASPGPGMTAGEERALRRIVAVTGQCREAGIRIFVETHDSHSRGDRTARFLSSLDRHVPGHPCEVVWDAAHSWSHGEDPAETFEAVAPWLAYVQVKDIRAADDPVPVMIGEGSYPIDRLMITLAAAGWRGWLSLEWERKWHPELPALDAALARVREWVRS
ncbi:sugar phosphate isomerase/epimerase [Phytoactinopolyspora alkaliphila]|uniref:Sugar phosphate isomerase/epimerase n=1 Tax=Phytoactinopolyspora alkaliphila TaxID=1783498 RepID=A0A6N9YK89_9ACTN|nr:sugar phosphate isomerase/epimerase family protein [Phytoactinopolyspora alkaliphila]NED95289.1 sugar phosphate isomerase/epimerase [Phytoactinopolyspora alkaliphila]